MSKETDCPPNYMAQPPPPQVVAQYGQHVVQQQMPVMAVRTEKVVETQVTVATVPIHPVVVPSPPDYMTRAVMVTLLCCWPIGIIAINAAKESRNAYSRGDFGAAEESAASAKRLSNIAIAAGVTIYIILLIIIISTTA